MTGNELFALLPLLTLGTFILILLVLVAFWRNLRLTCATASVGLVATLVSTYIVARALPLPGSPLLHEDGYALLFDGLIALATLMVGLMAFDDLRRRSGRGEEFYLLLLLSSLGGMVLVASVHFASFVLGLELLSVSLFALISYPLKGTVSVEASIKYLILSGVSSAFILFGIALVYLVTGSLSFSHLTSATAAFTTGGHYYLLGGLAMILAGFMFKLSLFPFHLWTPDVYEGAPAPVTAFVATVSKGAIFVLLLRLFVLTDMWRYQSVMLALSIIAGASIIAGNLLALYQRNVKRVLAYSSIAHLGYLMVVFIAAGIGGGIALATQASTYYLFAYFVTTLGAFGVVTVMSTSQPEGDVDDLADYQGLFWRRPVVATTFTAMLLSLAGIPLTAGFIGKFYVFAAGISSDLWVLVAMVIIGSGIGLYYYLSIVFTMASPAEGHEHEHAVRVPIAGGWVMAALTIVLVVFGTWPTPVINLIDHLVALA